MVVQTVIDPEVETAWSKLIDEKAGDEVQWLTARYESAHHIVLGASGQGGRKQCLESCPENEVIFGGFRVTAVDEGGASTAAKATVQRDESGESGSYRTKVIFFLYQNPNASMMVRARASSDRGAVQAIMKNSTCQFQIDALEDDFTEEEIAKKLNAVIGGQPDRYDFDNNIHRGRLQFDEPDHGKHDLNHAKYNPPVAEKEVEDPVVVSTPPPTPEPETVAEEEAPTPVPPEPETVAEEEAPTPAPPEPEAVVEEEAPTPAPEPEEPVAEAPATAPDPVANEEAAPAPIAVDVAPPEEAEKTPTVKKASPDSHAILLFTSVPASPVIAGDQNFIRQTFTGRKIPFVELDGMDAAKKEERNNLFSISGLRGKYPQVFVNLDGEISFIGDFDKMNELNDCDTLPPDILAANPQIETLTKTFAAFLLD